MRQPLDPGFGPGQAAIPWVRVYTLVCDNCGFIRQHLSSLVDGELLPKPPAPDGDKEA